MIGDCLLRGSMGMMRKTASIVSMSSATNLCGFFLAMLVLLCACASSASDAGCQQIILSIAPAWSSSAGKLQRFERPGGSWKAVSSPIPVLFGKNGLAWGRGIYGTNEPGLRKVEHDWRAPAGVFALGEIYGYDHALPPGGDYPYHQVTDADAWVDDPRSPDYNRHVVIDPAAPPPWFSKEKMRQKDFAYRWLIDVKHNEDPAIPGAGSAIFIHIRRGPSRPSSGCTTMAEEDLTRLITWLRADKRPRYALLPWAEYKKKWRDWELPDPGTADALAPR